MKDIKIFENEEFGAIRTAQDEKGNPIFCGSDVAKALGYGQPHKAVERHCRDDGMKRTVIDSIGRKQEARFINEGNVYRLIVKSKLPSAEKFEKWVFEEVLPSIRKYGGYITKETLREIFNEPENLHIFLKNMLIVSEENERLKDELATLEVKGEYFDKMMDSSLLVNFRTAAKQIGVKPLYLINFLLDKKYLYRNANQSLLPYQRYVEEGFFSIVEFCKHGHSGVQTLVTPQGKNHFLRIKGEGEMEAGQI